MDLNRAVFHQINIRYSIIDKYVSIYSTSCIPILLPGLTVENHYTI